jgi:glucose dehydrogenase
MTPDNAWGLTFWDEGNCRERLEAMTTGPIYTPPSLQGTVFFPSNLGGNNWRALRGTTLGHPGGDGSVQRGDSLASTTGNAVPMTYRYQGSQYVVIAAGGHFTSPLPASDHVMAFRLPR